MTDQILDLPEFLERVQDDKELLLELLDIYQEDYKTKRSLLEGAVANNNYDEVRNIAHSLKGASGNISAKLVHKIFYELENMGKNKALNGAAELLKNLDREYQQLSSRMQEVRKELL